MEEHEQQADELEEHADRMADRTDAVQHEIDDARSDLDSKLGDPQAPGLLEEEAAAPGGKGETDGDDNDDSD